MRKHYDYVIAGAGCAGLSLLYQMLAHPFFLDKLILLIDKEPKTKNDRTWCFWETQPGPFESIVYHRWPQIDFFSEKFSARFDLYPYTYKMIKGIDLYTEVLAKAVTFKNVDIIYAAVTNISTEGEHVRVQTGSIEVTAGYVFNSILPENWLQQARRQKAHILLQHFAGWWVETADEVFNSRSATFMDFRVSQQYGHAFVYVLPVAGTRALVEYTVFSDTLLSAAQYDAAIESYMSERLNVNSYTIRQKETGAIPMTSYRFPVGNGHVINMGTAGGLTKGSTGFTFQFIQKHATKIVALLAKGENPAAAIKLAEKRFRLYDNVLLNVLTTSKLPAGALFAGLFQKNATSNLFAFLNNESNLLQELKIMSTVPKRVFLAATVKELLP